MIETAEKIKTGLWGNKVQLETEAGEEAVKFYPITLAISLAIRYNMGGNIKGGRPRGVGAPHGPARVRAPLNTAILHRTTGLLYPFFSGMARRETVDRLCVRIDFFKAVLGI